MEMIILPRDKAVLFGDIGDRLNKYVQQYNKLMYDSQIYDDSAKKLDISKLIPQKELSRLLQSVTSSNIFGQSLFEKFFDLQVGRAARYSEYEQILYRIPEASQALQVYVDSILAPNVGDRENQMQFDISDDTPLSKSAKTLCRVMLNRSKFFDILPQIIYTTLLYGDSIVELDRTESGIRYILHTPKNCTILYDQKTDIELGVIIQQETESSKLLDMLSYAYPTLNVDVPDKFISIVSDIRRMDDDKERHIEMQIKALMEDLFKNQGAKYKYLSPRRYVKFPVYYNNMYYPYGTSLFDPVRSIAKQLLLVEAALSIYRATRTPLRTVWNIEVGSTPESEIPSLINGIMDRIRRQRVIDPENNGTTALDSIPEMMSLEEDIWSPSINGQPLIKAEPVPSGDISPYINDAEYFKKKLIAALGIPPAYLAEEQSASTRALLTLEDIKFSRTIRKYQTDINNALNELVNTCFLLTNNPQFYNKVTLSLPAPKTIEDNIRTENIYNRLNTADSFMKSFPNVPKLWVLKNIVGLSDDDIEDMVDMVEQQKNLIIFNEQEPGKLNEEGMLEGGGLGGGLGGGFEGEGLGGPELGEGAEEVESESLEGPLGEIEFGEEETEETETEEVPEEL